MRAIKEKIKDALMIVAFWGIWIGSGLYFYSIGFTGRYQAAALGFLVAFSPVVLGVLLHEWWIKRKTRLKNQQCESNMPS
jgi:hypothetical protein